MYNYHTHTYRCGHASGDIDDYVKFAQDNNVTKLGFSDHTPLNDSWWPEIRMNLEQLSDYCLKINNSKQQNKNIQIFSGMECDYFKEYKNFFKEVLLEENKLDFLVGSAHAYEHNNERIIIYDKELSATLLLDYAKQYISAMESGLFTYMAHPDLFALKISKWDENATSCSREILEAAKDLNMPLEINTSGYMKAKKASLATPQYPNENFWSIASEYNIKVYVNSDAHSPEQLLQYKKQGEDLAHRNNLIILEDLFTNK